MDITQDGITYRITDGIIRGWKGTSPFQKPFYNGVSIVESWTQADTDAATEAAEKQTVGELLDIFEQDGNDFYLEVRNLVRWYYDKDTITLTQFKNIRNILEPALRPLKLGDWDIAQDNMNAITRPSGVLGTLYDIVINKIDAYIIQ